MFDSTSKITIIGMTGSGKTTFCQKLQRIYPRVVVFDRMREYPAAKSDLNTCEVFTWSDFARAVRWSLNRKKFRIIVRFDVRAGNDDAFFEHAIWALYTRGDVCIVVEEVWNFANRHSMPRALKECYLTGRHRRIAVITTSQRPAEIHKTILSQSHHVICFSLFERNDIAYLTDTIGGAAAELPHLKKYHFLHFRPGQPTEIRKA